MILVITYTPPKNVYDYSGKLIEEAGVPYISHGVNINTGKTVILPDERLDRFMHNLIKYEGEYYLKER
jgi:hypothetical protein